MIEQTQQCVADDTPQKVKRKKSYPGKKADSYDNGWVKMYTYKWNKPRGIRFVVSPASYFDNRAHISLCIGWLQIYINLPIYSTWDDCEYPEYGFYCYEGIALVICKGLKTKHIYMPWSLDWVRTSKLKIDGTWLHERRGDVQKWKRANPGRTTTDRWKEEE